MRANVTTFVISLIIATQAAGITSRCSSFSAEDQEFIEQLCNANKSMKGGARHFCSDDFSKIFQRIAESNQYTYESPNRDADKVPYIAAKVTCEKDGLHFVTLNMYNVGLTFLPDSLGGLDYLSELYLVDNELRGLPATIGQLKRLKILDLTKNELLSLPDQLSECTAMILMRISWNPDLNSIPSLLTDSTAFPYLNIESKTNPTLVKQAAAPGLN